MTPRLTVVTPTLNASRHLRATLKSLDRCGTEVEHVVVDGGSTDGTIEIAAARLPTRVLTQAGNVRSMYAALNQGFAATRTPWITYLNADDLVLSGAYGRLLSVAESAGADVAYSDACSFRWNDGSLRCFLEPAWSNPGPILRMGGLPFVQPASIVRRQVWERLGGIDETFRIVGDAEFFQRAHLAGFKFVYVSGLVSAAFRRTGDSLGDRNVSAARREQADLRRRAHQQRVRALLARLARRARQQFRHLDPQVLSEVAQLDQGQRREGSPVA